METNHIQISNHIYCDPIFKDITIDNLLLPNPYKDFPYLIINDFISPHLCKEIVDLSKMSENINKAKVKVNTDEGLIKPKLNEKHRKTNILKLTPELKEIYTKQFLHYQPMMEEYFSIPLTYSTEVQMLQYKKGYFYTKHADDSSELIDDDKNTVGFINVAPRRKITTVLFTTSCEDKDDGYSFSGGELVFNYLYDKDGNQIKLRPKAGDMVVFPSNPYFSHEVLEVKSGYRLTLVQWHDGIVV